MNTTLHFFNTMYTYNFAINPKPSQVDLLQAMFEDMMTVQNWAISEREEYYAETGQGLSFEDQCAAWTQKRQSEPQHQCWSSGAQQEIIKIVKRSYNNAFRRLALGEKPGFPRYKTWKSFSSVPFVQRKGGATFFAIGSPKLKRRKTRHSDQTATVNILGIGHIKVRQHQEVHGEIKTIHIIRDRHKWFISIVTDHQPEHLPKTRLTVGVDVGKNTLAAVSDGTIEPAPQFLKQSIEELKTKQRRQHNCVGGTGQKRKAGEEISKTAIKRSRIVGNQHDKIKNRRKDHRNKLVNRFVHAYDVIYVEDLDIQGMIDGDAQFGPWAKSDENRNTYDAALGALLQRLFDKAESAGKQVIFVNPAYTSQRCYKCGHICRENRNGNKFKCVAVGCHYTEHADVNAALNILFRGSGGAFKTGPSDQCLTDS